MGNKLRLNQTDKQKQNTTTNDVVESKIEIIEYKDYVINIFMKSYMNQYCMKLYLPSELIGLIFKYLDSDAKSSKLLKN